MMAILVLFIMDLITPAVSIPFWAYLILIVVAIVWNVILNAVMER
jgi:hypothetical protein